MEKTIFAEVGFGTRKREVYLRLREEPDGVRMDIMIGEDGSYPKPAAEATKSEMDDFAPLLLLAEKIRGMVKSQIETANGRR